MSVARTQRVSRIAVRVRDICRTRSKHDVVCVCILVIVDVAAAALGAGVWTFTCGVSVGLGLGFDVRFGEELRAVWQASKIVQTVTDELGVEVRRFPRFAVLVLVLTTAAVIMLKRREVTMAVRMSVAMRVAHNMHVLAHRMTVMVMMRVLVLSVVRGSAARVLSSMMVAASSTGTMTTAHAT